MPCTPLPENAPLVKVRATLRWGAEVVLRGQGFDDAVDHARQLQQERGLTFVHAFDDEQIIAGQGTLGLELVEDVPDLAKIVVPVGGGGLAAGVAIAVKSLNPGVEVVGVQIDSCAPYPESLKAGKPMLAYSRHRRHPTGVIRHVSVNDLSVGRNVSETLRTLDAFQTDDRTRRSMARPDPLRPPTRTPRTSGDGGRAPRWPGTPATAPASTRPTSVTWPTRPTSRSS